MLYEWPPFLRAIASVLTELTLSVSVVWNRADLLLAPLVARDRLADLEGVTDLRVDLLRGRVISSSSSENISLK